MNKEPKGKILFTKKEVKKIKDLIKEKLVSDTNKQKQIRAKIRKIGFHFFDFYNYGDKYDIKSFTNLIDKGVIKVR